MKVLAHPFFIFLGASAALVGLSYGGPYVVQFINISYPFRIVHYLGTLQFAWIPDNLGIYSGINIYVFPSTAAYLPLQAAGIPPWLVQSSTAAVALAIGGFGTYRLSLYLSEGRIELSHRLAGLLAGFFYSFNILVVEVVFWDFIPYGLWFQALLPIEVLLLLKMFDSVKTSGRPDVVALGGFLLLSPLVLGANEPLNVSFVFLIATIALWKVLTSGHWIRRSLAVTAAILLLLAAINLYWLLPELILSGSSSGVNAPGNYAASVFAFQSYTGSLSSVSAFYLAGVGQGIFGWYGSLYMSGPFELALLPLVLVVFLPLLRLKSFGRKRERSSVLFFSAVLLIAAAFYSGVNSPLYVGRVRDLFLNPIVVQAIRNTGNALGYAISLSEAVLLGFGTRGILERFSLANQGAFRWLMSVSIGPHLHPHRGTARALWKQSQTTRAKGEVWLAIVLFGALVVPISLPSITGSLIPPSPYQARMSVPDFELQTAAFINDHAGTNYTMLVPGNWEEQNWSGYGGHGFDGTDVLEQLILTPTIYTPGGGLGGPVNPEISQAYSDLLLGSTDIRYANLLSMLRVQYLVLESGVGDRYPFGFPVYDNVSQISGFLASQTNLSLVRVIGGNSIYQNLQGVPSIVSSPSAMNSPPSRLTNITDMYFNATSTTYASSFPGSVSPVRVGGGQLALNATKELLLGGLPFPYYPTTFNQIALNIPIARYPQLVITFSTNTNTAISFDFSTSSTLSHDPGLFGAQWITTGSFSLPAPNAVPNPGWFYSPNHLTEVTIDFAGAYANLLTGSPGHESVRPALNFLSITLAPTLGNATELLRTNASNVKDLSARVATIFAETPVFSDVGGGISPIPREEHRINLTRGFAYLANLTQTPPIPPIRPIIGRDRFWLNVSSASIRSGLPFPGSPIAFNDIPLNLSLINNPFLVVSFRTNPFTAVSFGATYASSLSTSYNTFEGEWLNFGTLSSPPPNARPNLPWYYSPGRFTTIVVNIGSILTPTDANIPRGQPGQLTFLYLALTPTEGNSTEYLGGNSSRIQNESVEVNMLTLTNTYQYYGGNASVSFNLTRSLSIGPSSPSGFDPRKSAFFQGLMVIPQITRPMTVYFREISPVEWRVDLGGVSGYTLVVFFQNWNLDWKASCSNRSLEVAHVVTDGYANGWIVGRQGFHGNITLNIVYDLQRPLTIGIDVSSLVASALVLILGLSFRSRIIDRARLASTWLTRKFGRGLRDRRRPARRK